MAAQTEPDWSHQDQITFKCALALTVLHYQKETRPLFSGCKLAQCTKNIALLIVLRIEALLVALLFLLWIHFINAMWPFVIVYKWRSLEYTNYLNNNVNRTLKIKTLLFWLYVIYFDLIQADSTQTERSHGFIDGNCISWNKSAVVILREIFYFTLHLAIICFYLFYSSLDIQKNSSLNWKPINLEFLAFLNSEINTLSWTDVWTFLCFWLPMRFHQSPLADGWEWGYKSCKALHV